VAGVTVRRNFFGVEAEWVRRSMRLNVANSTFLHEDFVRARDTMAADLQFTRQLA
jgi:hypothetical protein